MTYKLSQERTQIIRTASWTVASMLGVCLVTAGYADGLGDGTTQVTVNNNDWYTAAYWTCILDCFWRWLLAYTFSFFAYILTVILQWMPSGFFGPIEQVTNYLAIMNTFLPMAEAAVLATTWFAFWGTFILIKYTLKLIPTIG